MICFENVSFQYESERHPALREFTHSIAKGELVLLLGPSGCGKTTITRLLNGLVPHFYEGELKGIVRIGGRTTTETTIQSLADIVGSVFQDPRSQFFATDVTSEIAFSCENAGLPRNEIHRRVENASRKLGIESLLGRSIFALSSGEKQAVAVASVYAFAPSVIVMDEPSPNLDPMATQKLREIIQALRTDGFTIVISEHRIHYLTDLVDRAIFIQNGKMIQEFQKDAFQAITNAEANKLGLRSFYLDALPVPNQPSFKTDIVALELEQVTAGYTAQQPVIQNLNLKVNQGEILGIVGHNGVGKTTLLETICGLQKERSGQIKFHGIHLTPKKRIQETYLVMQDSDYQLFTESVESELLLEHENDPEAIAKANGILQNMGLDELRERHPASLSGGQKQRLSIAVAYQKNASVICFDEPTSGLDFKNMLRVRNLFQEMATEGKTLLVISHDYEFLLATCQRVLCLFDDYRSECFAVTEQTKEHLADVMQMR